MVVENNGQVNNQININTDCDNKEILKKAEEVIYKLKAYICTAEPIIAPNGDMIGISRNKYEYDAEQLVKEYEEFKKNIVKGEDNNA